MLPSSTSFALAILMCSSSNCAGCSHIHAHANTYTPSHKAFFFTKSHPIHHTPFGISEPPIDSCRSIKQINNPGRTQAPEKCIVPTPSSSLPFRFQPREHLDRPQRSHRGTGFPVDGQHRIGESVEEEIQSGLTRLFSTQVPGLRLTN